MQYKILTAFFTQQLDKPINC